MGEGVKQYINFDLIEGASEQRCRGGLVLQCLRIAAEIAPTLLSSDHKVVPSIQSKI